MIKPLLHDDPSHIGSYRLAARLGSGGMGTVYLARTPGGATVALKTVHAHIAADASFRTRFRLEADAARVIGGVHGAQVVDADPLAQVPWLATEYVLGPPLDDAVAVSGPLPEAAVRAVGAALCGALGQLHRSDVVHRDLKPSNVMITGYGPKVIDFGIARALGDDRLTQVGAAAGTPAFMSPEQAGGQEHTPAGDVFALAGVLVFAATGHGPFGSGQPADLLYRVRYADPDLSGVPAALAPVLARALSKDPALRPDTGELAAALHDGHGEFADHLPHPLLSEISRRAAEVWQVCPPRLPAPEEPAVTVTSAPAPRRAGPSRRGFLVLAGAAGAGAVAGGGLWLWSGRSAPKSAAKNPPKPGPSGSGAVTSPPGPWDLLWTSGKGKADEAMPPLFVDKGIVVKTGGQLRGIDPADGSELWMFFPTFFEGRPVTDGSSLYWIGGATSDDFVVATVDTDTGRQDRTLTALSALKAPKGASAELLCATADTVYLTAGDDSAETFDRHLYAVNARTGKLRWRTALRDRKDGYGYTGAFGKVIGDRIVVGQTSNDLILSAFDTGSGKEQWRTSLTSAADNFSTPASTGAQLAHDGTHLYLGSTVLMSVGLSNGTVVWEFGRDRDFGGVVNGDDRYGPPAVKDGVVYAAEGGRGIVAVETERGELLWDTAVPDGSATTAAAPPVVSGKYLYYADQSGLGAIELSSHAYVRSLESSIRNFVLMPGKDVLVGNGTWREVDALRLGG
ncbi:serine/threonine-protein kinase [Streptomyces sp. NBC_00876]|uniref:protein kinase domain-containing protein n=1 Tax=Streptomyces sp. NBC_00876 TaxID=2975853 RepID=UPI003868164B|nr:serine/threonine-protein kinase [Streptomyces sp. NBC_00876]